MSMTAQLKTKSKKQSYLINLNFDIPLKNQKLAIDQPLSGEFTIIKKTINKKVKLNVGVIKTARERENKKLFRSEDGNFIDTSRSSKKSNGKDTSRTFQQTKRYIKNLMSNNHNTSKSPFRSNHKCQKNSNIVNNAYLKKLPKQMMSTLQDDIMGYTNPSSQLKAPLQLQQTLPNRPNYLYQFESNESFHTNIINEIKRYELAAEEKKVNQNIQYIRQKFLIQTSARKIQRAWKKYKTRKIIYSYSNIIVAKGNNLKLNELSINKLNLNTKVLNVKSKPYKNGKNIIKNEMKKFQQPNYENQIQQSNRQRQINKNNQQQLQQTLQQKKKIQLQQIQKWQQFIKQIRKNNTFDEVLLDINIHESKKNKKNKKDVSNQIQKDKKKKYIKKTINWYQNTTVQEENKEIFQQYKKQKKQSSQCSSNQLTNHRYELYHNGSPEQKLGQQPIISQSQQQKIKTNLQKYFDNIELKQLSIIAPTEQKYFSQIFQLNQKSQQLTKDLTTNYKKFYEDIKSISIQNQPFEGYILQKDERCVQTNVKEKKKDKSDKIQKIVKQIEVILIIETIAQIKGKLNLVYLLKNVKQQGISTDVQSIKDYLQNLISFILQQNPESILQSFNTYFGPNQLTILKQAKLSSSEQYYNYEHKQMLNKQFFYTHWTYAQNLISFQKKYKEDMYAEMTRIQKLKNITKIYFQAIFDGFCQCLEPFRRNGFDGQPLIWEVGMSKQPLIENVEDLTPMIKNGYQNLSNLTTIFCGIYAAQKQPNLSQQIISELQEERMRIFLEDQIKVAQPFWKSFRKQKTWVLCSISSLIAEILLVEFFFELFQFEIKFGF